MFFFFGGKNLWMVVLILLILVEFISDSIRSCISLCEKFYCYRYYKKYEFELCRSIYMWIFFSVSIAPLFSFYKSLSKYGETFVLNWGSHYVDSKEIGFGPWFHPNCSRFLLLGKSFISSWVSRQRGQYTDIQLHRSCCP